MKLLKLTAFIFFFFSAITPLLAQKNTTLPVKFDLKKIPVSHKELGEFPFFEFPAGIKAQNTPYQNMEDHLFVPIDGKFQEFTGPVWRSFVVANGENWSQFSFNKKLQAWLLSKGAVLIYSGKVSKNQLDLINDKMEYKGGEGSLDYWNDPVNLYIIRRPNDKNVLVQFCSNTASGAIQIIETQM